MEQHILDMHVEQGSARFYHCDECTFKTKGKETFGKHFKDKHSTEASEMIIMEENGT